jgi:hypothetical protein
MSLCNLLQPIDDELRREAKESLAVLETELDAIAVRTKAAELLGRNDLLEQLETLRSERCARRAVLRATLDALPHEEPEPPAAEEPESTVAVSEQTETVAVNLTPPPQVTVEPEPEPVQAAPVVEPATRKRPRSEKPRMKRGDFQKRVREFHALEKQVADVDTGSTKFEALMKSLACECRALQRVAEEIGEDSTTLDQSFDLLRDQFNDTYGDKRFFAFNSGRDQPYETWHECSEAFRLIPVAEDCLDWLADADVEPDQRKELLIGCAAVESWLYRLSDDRGMQALDSLQAELHKRVDRSRGDVWIPWWQKGQHSTDAVAAAAKQLQAEFHRLQQAVDGRARKIRSKEALADLVVAEAGEFYENFIPAVLECLAAGVAPSDKKLVELCLPYQGALEEYDAEPGVRKLREYIGKQQTLFFSKAKKHPSAIEQDLPEVPGQVAELRELLSGKAILFMGGKRQDKRVKELEKALGLGALIWPDADQFTTPSTFEKELGKADVVCYLIRWSRHSYKQVLDKAKDGGKLTAVLKAGIGKNRVIHDLHHQLIANKGQ